MAFDYGNPAGGGTDPASPKDQVFSVRIETPVSSLEQRRDRRF